jgi:hypothetical protein
MWSVNGKGVNYLANYSTKNPYKSVTHWTQANVRVLLKFAVFQYNNNYSYARTTAGKETILSGEQYGIRIGKKF